MTISTTSTAVPDVLRVRGLEMPWNRVLQSSAEAAGAARALGPWHPQEFLAECVETVPEAGNMMTFVLRRTDGAPLAFRPGQYLNIAFPVDGPDAEPVNRSYSISSAPTQPWAFAITVKRDDGGKVSPWVHENVRPGTVLEVLGPVGAFHLPDHDRRARYLFLAAGAGITPLMSMIRTIHSLPGRADVVVLYHGAAPGAFAFSMELEYIASVDSRIKVYYSLGDRSAPGKWQGMVGRLTAEMIEEVAPDANGRQIYACGPEPYLDVAGQLLERLGVDDTSFHVESFNGSRETILEYKEEVALAGEIAEEIAAAHEEFYEQQPAALELYGSGYEAVVAGHSESGTDSVAEAAAEIVDEAADDYAWEEDAVAAQNGQQAGAAAAEPVDPSSFEVHGEGSLTMSFVRTRVNVRIDPGQQILGAARKAGVRIGANCQEGMCGSCKIVKLEGEVDMHHQGGIRAREIEAGKFLPCCSTANTDLVVDA
ncbi:iron-sulfur cluster-binding domain-containing protein [Zhihengliuella sp.]|uniref:flavin reductase family protein n=1 Tax=Zhihengliuella sp. TaxID=1954483 RepID=UPI002810CEB2|nr:iron-sulfur cluster-binding domain-containing protein [Zhihengliuella sp.]